jgi:nitroreductase
MDFADVVRTRSSVRDYDPARPVPRPALERILETGRLAPSAANRQPWRFIVVSSPEALAKVRRCCAKPYSLTRETRRVRSDRNQYSLAPFGLSSF